MIKACILFILGLLLLIFGGDYFVDGASSIAKRFHIPELLIGATVVSIGTTLPEVMVSATAALENHGQIAYGNAIGSIICNTALILALTISLKPSKVERKTLYLPLTFFFIAAILYSFFAYIDGKFSRIEGIILLFIFVVYMLLQIKDALKNNNINNNNNNEVNENKQTVILAIIKIIGGAIAIAFGANFLVDNGTIIAKAIGVPESVIALTFVALGTSLPELITAITSLRKGHGLLSLGNIIGANFFNLVLVSGISITLCPFIVPIDKVIFNMNASYIIDIPLVFISMLIIAIPALLKGNLYKWQGILLLTIYALYCFFQFI